MNIENTFGEFLNGSIALNFESNKVGINILEAVIDNMTEELIIFDKDSHYIMRNKSARNNVVYDCTKLRSIYDLFEQVKYYDLKGNLLSFEEIPSQRVLRGEKLEEYRLKLISNSSGLTVYKEYSGNPIYDNCGNIIGGFVLARLIEEQIKIMENAYLNTQYESLKKIIENLDLGFARYSYPEFNIIDINHKGYTQLKGLIPDLVSQSELLNMNLYDILDEKVQMIDDFIQETLKKNKASCHKISKYIVNEKAAYVKWIYQPLLDLYDNIKEVIVVGLDVTNEVKEKHKIIKVLKTQDEMYANVSHELKTPLNVIFSANQMMDIYLNSDSLDECKCKLKEYNRSIKQNCYRLIKLINNIVDLSKVNSGLAKLDLINVNIVDIIECIVNSVTNYVKFKGLKIIFDTNVEEKIIACDVNKIERVILNLISNAVKFSEPDGNIIVEVLDRGDNVLISVKDTGTGIDEKKLGYLFQRFYQADKSMSRNAEGSGIGLSLVKSIIVLHGGNISVESQLGKGSTFTVELPAKTINEVQTKVIDTCDKVEMLKVEFSDIYSID